MTGRHRAGQEPPPEPETEDGSEVIEELDEDALKAREERQRALEEPAGLDPEDARHGRGHLDETEAWVRRSRTPGMPGP